MNLKLTVWIVWIAFSFYWLVAAVYSTIKLSLNSQWRPKAIDLYQKTFGSTLSTKFYVGLICFAAAIVITSGFWLPRLIINLLSKSK